MQDIAALQAKILEIAVYFDEFCQKHGIVYYLMGGSALGAMRHQGFIPWDDDFDVFMTFENYSRLLEIGPENIDSTRFYLQKEDTTEWPMFFSKLRLNGTTFIEADTRHRCMHKGVYIDIMCLNNVAANAVVRYVQYISARVLTAMTLGVRGYLTNSWLKRVAVNLGKLLMCNMLKNCLLRVVRGLNKRDAGYVGHFFGRASFKNTCFPVRFLGKPRYVAFSDALLPVPEQVEDYLALRYGDYMKIPDAQTIASFPVHAAYVDLARDYREYEQSEASGK